MRSYDYSNRKGVRALTWEEFHALTLTLAERLEALGVEAVVGIARAGLLPAGAGGGPLAAPPGDRGGAAAPGGQVGAGGAPAGSAPDGPAPGGDTRAAGGASSSGENGVEKNGRDLDAAR